MSTNDTLILETYGRGLAVFGDTKPYNKEFKEMGARFNPSLTRDGSKVPGWVVSKAGEQAARDFIDSVNKRQPAPATTRQPPPVRTASPKPAPTSSMYSQLSSYSDIYVANLLARNGEDVGDDVLANRFNLHVYLIQEGKLDKHLVSVLSSTAYSSVSEVTGIEAARELGLNEIEVLPTSTVFDTHVCLTALRMVNSGDQLTPFAIDLVRNHSNAIADKLASMVKKPEIKRKPVNSPPRKPVTVPRKNLPQQEDSADEHVEPASEPKPLPTRQTSAGRRQLPPPRASPPRTVKPTTQQDYDEVDNE